MQAISPRRRALGVGTLLLIGCALPVVPEPRLTSARGPTAVLGGPGRVRLMSLNIAHGSGQAIHPIVLPAWRFRPNLALAAKFLRREQPAIVALQEVDATSTYTGDFDHLQYLGRQAGFAHAVLGIHVVLDFFGPRLQAGTALLAAQGLADVASHKFDTGFDDLQGFVVARTELATAPPLEVDVVSVHLQPSSAEGREAQVDQLAARLHERDRLAIVIGDFNCPWTGDALCVGRFARLLGLRAFAPEAPWPSFSVTDPHVRLDWVLIPPELEFVTYDHLDDRVSDHRPVLATVARLGTLATRGLPPPTGPRAAN